MKIHLAIVCTLALVVASPVAADTLLIQRVERSDNSVMPTRGTTMDTVRAQYGEPARAMAAVGQPPITRWDYPAFSVYFEHSYVIDSVMSKSAPLEIGPRPVAEPR